MGLILAPIEEGKVNDWKNWVEELVGEKKTEFDAMNKRHGITRHSVWLAETPSGTVAAVLHEGPGADTFMPNIAQSENSFDAWFKKCVEDLNGMDLGAPPPGPMPVQMI